MGIFSSETDQKRIPVQVIINQLEKDELPGCCGIQIIWDFQAFHISELKASRSNLILALKVLLKADRQKAMILMSCNHEQKRVLSTVFIDLGFKLVSSGVNHSYEGNKVYLYSKVLNKIRSKPKSKPKSKRKSK